MESADSIDTLRSQYANLDSGNTLWDVSNGIAVIIFMLIIFSVIFYGISSLSNIAKIRKNWPQYRCNPSIMPFASLYGYDAADNFQFCMGKVFEEHSGDYTSSFTTMLRGVTGVLGTLLGSLNSMRLSIATMGGGINVIFQEFVDRIRAFFFRVRISAIQIKQLMFRLYATFFSVIYIGLSAITGMQSLGNTVLFKFLDTFCFDPDTMILVSQKGYIPIKSVEIGDILLPRQERVTAVFQFYANGQPMVLLPRQDSALSGQEYIKVSTNHYIWEKQKEQWIRAGNHPRAYARFEWMGGKRYPLICLNTDKNTITFSDEIIFADYDETSIADSNTMKTLQGQVNRQNERDALRRLYTFSEYSPAVSPNTLIKNKQGFSVPANQIELYEVLSTNSRVVGIVKKEITEWCKIDNSIVTPSTMIWNSEECEWIRAGETLEIKKTYPTIFYGFFMAHSSQIELADGQYIRDYIEIFSPDSEKYYAETLSSADSFSS